MKFLIPVLVGAVIGYITNWLAIKMLFRPHREIRILGFKMPFTPGLIPKERGRIAKNVGETVGTHLLTPEIVVGALCSEKIDKQISDMIMEKVKELRESRSTIKDAASKITGVSNDVIDKKLEETLTGIIVSKIGSESVRKDVRDIIHKKLLEGRKHFKKSEIYERLMEYVLVNIKTSLASGDTREIAMTSIQERIESFRGDSRTIEEVIPSSLIQSVRLYIHNNRSMAAELIKEGLETQSVRDKLKLTVASMVEENLGRLVTMFISPDTIGNKVIESLEKYLEKPENQENIAALIINSIDRFLSKEISGFAENLKSEEVMNLSSELAGIVFNSLGKEGVFSRLKEIIEVSFVDSGEEVVEIITSNIDNYMEGFTKSEEFRALIKSVVSSYVLKDLLNQPISLYISKLSGGHLERVIAIVKDSYNEFIKTKASQVVELIDIAGIVEDRINSFDVAFGEKIILDVARKELGAITWLGAILGGIMGAFSPLLQMITM